MEPHDAHIRCCGGKRRHARFETLGLIDADEGKSVLSQERERRLPVLLRQPQGFKSSVPPFAATTADVGIVRFHGRKAETWEKKNVSPTERFDYYYSDGELSPWAGRIRDCAASASDVHVLFNTNNGDQGVVNARLMAKLL